MSVFLPNIKMPKWLRGRKNWRAFLFFVIIAYYIPLGIICGLYAINREGGIPAGSTASDTFILLFVIPLSIALAIGFIYLICYSFYCWVTGKDMLS